MIGASGGGGAFIGAVGTAMGAFDSKGSGGPKLPEGPSRCSNCVNYTEVWYAQPGVSWDRCKAAKDADGEYVGCYGKNNDRQCKGYRRDWFGLKPASKDIWYRVYF